MRNLRVTITRKNFGSRVLLEGVSFDFAKPGLYLLTGPNGAGKSTFLSILAGQDNDYDGSLDLDGQVISKRLLPDYFERFVSFTPQDPVIFSDLSVLDNLLLPFAKKDKTKAIELLQNLGLGQQLHSVGADLSAGEKQRVAFGRALYADKPIVLLDEITANLDKGNRAVIEKAIMELSNSRIVIFAAHDCGAFASFPTLTHLQIKGGHMTVLSQGSANNDQTGFKDDKDLIKGSVWRFLFSKLREFKAHFLVSLLSFTACVALLSFGISYSASFDEGRENSFFSEDIYSSFPMIVSSAKQVDQYVENHPDAHVLSFGFSEETVFPQSGYMVDGHAVIDRGFVNDNRPFNCLSGCLYLSSESDLSVFGTALVAGRFPISGDEALVSNSILPLLCETVGLSPNLDASAVIEYFSSHIVFAERISEIEGAVNLVNPFKITGVYEDFSLPAQAERMETAYSAGVEYSNASFGIGTVTMIKIEKGATPDLLAVLVDDSLLKSAPFELIEGHYGSLGVYPSFLMDRDGGELFAGFPSLVDGDKGKGFFAGLSIGTLVILSLSVIASFCFATKRRFALLRAVGERRQRLFYGSLACLLTGAGLGVIIGCGLGSAGLLILGLVLNSRKVGLPIEWLKWDPLSFALPLVFLVAFGIAVFLAVAFYLLPKHDESLLIETKRK